MVDSAVWWLMRKLKTFVICFKRTRNPIATSNAESYTFDRNHMSVIMFIKQLRYFSKYFSTCSVIYFSNPISSNTFYLIDKQLSRFYDDMALWFIALLKRLQNWSPSKFIKSGCSTFSFVPLRTKTYIQGRLICCQAIMIIDDYDLKYLTFKRL